MALELLVTDFDLSFGSYVPIGVQLHGPNRAGAYLQTFKGCPDLELSAFVPYQSMCGSAATRRLSRLSRAAASFHSRHRSLGGKVATLKGSGDDYYQLLVIEYV